MTRASITIEWVSAARLIITTYGQQSTVERHVKYAVCLYFLIFCSAVADFLLNI